MREILVASMISLISFAAAAQDGSTSASTDEIRSRRDLGLAIEPMLIYQQEDAKIRTSQLPVISDDTSATSRGYGFGLKLGGHIGDILTAGVDGRYMQTTLDDSAYGKARTTKYSVGPTVGVQMPIVGLRLFGTYVLAGAVDPEAGTQDVDVRFRDPRGYRLGAGFHIGPISLNLEYENISYLNTQVQSYGLIGGNGNSDIDFDTRGYLASVSFPLSL